MNKREQEMLAILVRLKADYGCVGVKAEFEAEGTRIEELLRLVDITKTAGVKLGIKIGGCEAIKDILDAKQIGVDYLIAPMIESQYALEKYHSSIQRTYTSDDLLPQVLFNIETKTGLSQAEKLSSFAQKSDILKGIVFGRVDFALSMGMPRDEANSKEILIAVKTVSELCKQRNLELILGGSVSLYAIDFLREVQKIRLDRYETRKIIFDASNLQNREIQKGLLLAVKFELLWLINKKSYYHYLGEEDAERINVLESRWNVLEGNI